MRFVVDADLPRSTVLLLQEFGHEGTDVRDVGLRSADDSEIAAYARQHHACLLTGDFGFGDIRNYPPDAYHGIVVIQAPKSATRDRILALVRSLLGKSDIVARLPGRLAIVEAGRVRLRPK